MAQLVMGAVADQCTTMKRRQGLEEVRLVVDPSGKLEDTFRRSTALPYPEGVLPL